MLQIKFIFALHNPSGVDMRLSNQTKTSKRLTSPRHTTSTTGTVHLVRLQGLRIL